MGGRGIQPQVEGIEERCLVRGRASGDLAQTTPISCQVMITDSPRISKWTRKHDQANRNFDTRLVTEDNLTLDNEQTDQDDETLDQTQDFYSRQQTEDKNIEETDFKLYKKTNENEGQNTFSRKKTRKFQLETKLMKILALLLTISLLPTVSSRCITLPDNIINEKGRTARVKFSTVDCSIQKISIPLINQETNAGLLPLKFKIYEYGTKPGEVLSTEPPKPTKDVTNINSIKVTEKELVSPNQLLTKTTTERSLNEDDGKLLPQLEPEIHQDPTVAASETKPQMNHEAVDNGSVSESVSLVISDEDDANELIDGETMIKVTQQTTKAKQPNAKEIETEESTSHDDDEEVISIDLIPILPAIDPPKDIGGQGLSEINTMTSKVPEESLNMEIKPTEASKQSHSHHQSTVQANDIKNADLTSSIDLSLDLLLTDRISSLKTDDKDNYMGNNISTTRSLEITTQPIFVKPESVENNNLNDKTTIIKVIEDEETLTSSTVPYLFLNDLDSATNHTDSTPEERTTDTFELSNSKSYDYIGSITKDSEDMKTRETGGIESSIALPTSNKENINQNNPTLNGNKDKEALSITYNTGAKVAESTNHITTIPSLNNSKEKTSIMSNNGDQTSEKAPPTGDIAEMSIGNNSNNKEKTSTLSTSIGNSKETKSITSNAGKESEKPTNPYITTVSFTNNDKEKTSTMSYKENQATKKELLPQDTAEILTGNNSNNKDRTSTLSTSNGNNNIETITKTSNAGKAEAEPTRHRLTTISSVNNIKEKISTASNKGDQITEKLLLTGDIYDIPIGNSSDNKGMSSTVSPSYENNDKEKITIVSNAGNEAAETKRHHITTISSVNNSKEKTSTVSNNGDQTTEKVLITGNITEISVGNYNNKEKTTALSTINGNNDIETISITSNNGKEAAEPTIHQKTTMSSVNNIKANTSTVSNNGDQTTEKVFQTVDVAEISIGNYFNYEATPTLSTSNG